MFFSWLTMTIIHFSTKIESFLFVFAKIILKNSIIHWVWAKYLNWAYLGILRFLLILQKPIVGRRTENTASHTVPGILKYYTHECVSFALQMSELVSTEAFRDMMLLAASPHVLEGRKINERKLQKLGTIDVLLMEQQSSRGILVVCQGKQVTIW